MIVRIHLTLSRTQQESSGYIRGIVPIGVRGVRVLKRMVLRVR